MKTESRRKQITTHLSTLHRKKEELLGEGRKLLSMDGLSKTNLKEINRELDILSEKYKELEIKEEFCQYSLMLDYVLEK